MYRKDKEMKQNGKVLRFSTYSEAANYCVFYNIWVGEIETKTNKRGKVEYILRIL